MLWRAMISGSFLLLAMSAAGAQPLSESQRLTRFVTSERNALTSDGSSDFEKRRAARYGLSEPDNDFYDYQASDDVRFKWRLTRVKMRVPFDTSAMK
jgi:hypothetical protein